MTPAMVSSPMQAIAALWGGELPVFDNVDAADELIGALAVGLWSRLARHQERSAPFRLTRINVPVTRQGVVQQTLMRREELNGLKEGLFGGEASLDLPARAHRAYGVLREMAGLIDGMRVVVEREAPDADAGITGFIKQQHDFTRIAEHEIHELVLSCRRARRRMLAGLLAHKPVVH